LFIKERRRELKQQEASRNENVKLSALNLSQNQKPFDENNIHFQTNKTDICDKEGNLVCAKTICVVDNNQ